MRKILLSLLLVSVFALPAWATFDFTFTGVKLIGIGEDYEQLHLLAILTNTGDERDSYAVHKDETLPAMWSSSICVGDFCYAPFLHDVDVTDIDPGESVELYSYINLSDAGDVGTVDFSVTSAGAPGLSAGLIFTGYRGSAYDLTLVDDGGAGSDIATIFTDALVGKTAIVWPRFEEIPHLSDLHAQPQVYWLTGEEMPTLTESDRELLSNFLNQSGGLVLSGADIAEDLCDPASPNYSQESLDWFENTLGLEYLSSGTSQDIAGEPGDDLGDGLSFTLVGNQTPDLIDFTRDGPAPAVSFRYGSGAEMGEIAGTSFSGGKRLVFLAYGMEGAGDDLTTIIDRSYDLIRVPTSVPAGQAAAGLVDLGNQPNPFNPKTTLRFLAPAAGAAKVDVLDARGRMLFSTDAQVQVGENEVVFPGVDASGKALPSGIYLYRISQGAQSVSGKMTLLK